MPPRINALRLHQQIPTEERVGSHVVSISAQCHPCPNNGPESCWHGFRWVYDGVVPARVLVGS